MSGYVRIHRSLVGHPAFRNDAEAMAFAWMVVRAAWKPIRVRYKERGIHLQRGQLAVSVRDFAAAHERNKNWVSRILNRMRDEGMIETEAGTGVLVITICNYDQYQSDAGMFETASGTGKGTPQGTDAGQTRDTEQVKEELNKLSSEANASGCADPLKELFDLGVSILTGCGQTQKEARSLIGKWRKAKSDGEVLTALLECRTRSISSPVEWLTKRLEGSEYVSPSGYRYRGDAKAVMREAEQRADWGTYWQAKGDAEGRRATG